MKKICKIIFPTLFAGLCLCSCTDVENHYFEFEYQLGKEKCKIICDSFFERPDVKEDAKKIDIELSFHLGVLDNSYSIDVLNVDYNGDYLQNCNIYYGVAGGKFIHSYCLGTKMNLCDLDQKKSYSLTTAYNNNLINDSDIDQIIKWAYEQGIRKTDGYVDIDGYSFVKEI